MKEFNFIIGYFFVAFLSIGFSSAVVINSVEVGDLSPGGTATLKVEIKNILSEDVKDVSLILNLENTEFTTIGSNEDSEEEIRDDDEEAFTFALKAANEIAPGDYNIPYKIIYTDTGDDEKKEKTGSFGITVNSETEIETSIETENNIVGEQGKIVLKVVNKGLGEIKFVSVEISGTGFSLIGTNQEYVGTISSDDFETATFNVVFNSKNPRLIANINYRDFENNKQTGTIDFPIKVYSKEEALKLGLIKRSNTGIYVGIIIALILIWFIYRKLRKIRKRNNIKK